MQKQHVDMPKTNKEKTPRREKLSAGHILLGLYILLSPLYLFKSGMPQPADLIMLAGITMMLIILSVKEHKHFNVTLIAGIGFVLYTILINIANFVYAPDNRFLFATLFYGYNFLAFCYVIFMTVKTPQLTKIILRYCLYAVIALQVIFLLFFEEKSGYRSTGTFNNPNQLAYWSLLGAMMLILLRKGQTLSIWDIAAYIALGFIQTKSLSKAGLITFSMFSVFLLFTPALHRYAKYTIIVIALIAGLFAVLNIDRIKEVTDNLSFIERSIKRLENIGHEKDDSLEGRGYDRIWKFPEYIILGAGEGAHGRFHPTGRNQELHSGLATVLFSYGIPGSVLFALFVLSIFHRRPLTFLGMLGIIILFGAVHQNIRFTHFWIFLALIYSWPYLRPDQQMKGTA
jgi:hypothetical protein